MGERIEAPMADEARREKVLRDLASAGQAMADEIELLEAMRASERGRRPNPTEADRFREALEEARHLGVVPW